MFRKRSRRLVTSREMSLELSRERKKMYESTARRDPCQDKARETRWCLALRDESKGGVSIRKSHVGQVTDYGDLPSKPQGVRIASSDSSTSHTLKIPSRSNQNITDSKRLQTSVQTEISMLRSNQYPLRFSLLEVC